MYYLLPADEVTKAKRALHFTLERIDSETAFVLHQVEPMFCPKTCFSDLDLRLTVHSDDERKVSLNFDKLFKVETKPEFNEAINFIHRCRQKPWPCFNANPDSEKSVMLDISSEILAPLCTEVILEKRYKADLSSYLSRRPMLATATLECSDIGIGSINTWHGTPDVRVRGGGVHFVHRKGEEGEDTSDGMTPTIEGKSAFNDYMAQTVATCVVSSFTERALHPDKPALIPTVLIDKYRFRVCLYDCEKDVLLISSEKSLSTKGGLSQSGMALLWVVLNHR